MPDEPPPLRENLAPTDETSRRAPIRFLKLKPGQRQHVTILSDSYVGGVTHYARGRMKLHRAADCPFCEAGQKPRWYAWLNVWTEKTATSWIIQMSTGQHGALILAQDRWTTLRGLEAELSREGRAPNTPLVIAISGAPNIQPHHPEPVDIVALLTVYMDWSSGTAESEPPPEPLT